MTDSVADSLTAERTLATVSDKMQRNCRYRRTEPAGKNFAPDFVPELTPRQMLALGVFGGKHMTDCTGEFPADWLARAKLSPQGKTPQLNYFSVAAPQPLSTMCELRRKSIVLRPLPAAPSCGYDSRQSVSRRRPRISRNTRRVGAL